MLQQKGTPSPVYAAASSSDALVFHGITSRLVTPQSLSINISCLACNLNPFSCAKRLRNRPAAAWSTQLFLQRAERKFQNPPGVVPSVLPPAVQPAVIQQLPPQSTICLCTTTACWWPFCDSSQSKVSSGLGASWTLALCRQISERC